MSIITEGAEMKMDGGLISEGTDLVATLWEMQQNMSVIHVYMLDSLSVM